MVVMLFNLGGSIINTRIATSGVHAAHSRLTLIPRAAQRKRKRKRERERERERERDRERERENMRDRD